MLLCLRPISASSGNSSAKKPCLKASINCIKTFVLTQLSLMETNLLIYLVLGLFAGLYSAIWGAYKDSPYEGFKSRSFVRSLLLGIACSTVVYIFVKKYPETIVSSLSVIFFASMGLERQLTDAYKGFIRTEDQKKYRIPTYIGLYGRIIKDLFLRMLIGLVFLTAFFAFLFWLRNFLNITNLPYFIKILTASSVGGIYVSLGGANKDGPFEGLNKLKIWRSEIIAVAFGFLFSFFTNDWIILGYTAIGAERFCIEFYKSFILRKKPGKFR